MFTELARSTLLLFLAVITAPAINTPVVDVAGVLDPASTRRIEEQVRELRRATGAQMAVVLVQSTEGEPIEDFSQRTATQWGGGARGRDDGLLLTLAIADRRSRLEVGYGLEADLPDAAVRAILDGMRPALRERAYDRALTGAIAEIRARLPPRDAGPVERARFSAARALRAPRGFLVLCAVAALAGWFAARERERARARAKRGGDAADDAEARAGRRTVLLALGAPTAALAALLAPSGTPGLLALLAYVALVAVFYGETAVLLRRSVRVGALLWGYTVANLALGANLLARGVSAPDCATALGATTFVSFFVVLGFMSGGSGHDGSGDGWSYSSASSGSSSSSYSSSSSSSSSGSSDWGGGGGSFGGGGASSSW